MSALLKRIRLGHALWGSFGLLLLLFASQGAVVVTQIAAVETAGDAANHGVLNLNEELRAVETKSQTTAEAVGQLAKRVQVELAGSMKRGEADMQILQRNVASAVTGTAEIVAQLEDVLDNVDLDEDTAGLIEDLLFSAEDSADRIRKEALPLVRAGVERLSATAEMSRSTAEEIGRLTTTMGEFATASRNATEQAVGVSDQIRQAKELAGGARWVTLAAVAVVVVVGVGVPLILVPSTNSEVRRTVGALEAIAGGDLGERLRSQSFVEFGRIATALNQAVGSMESAVQTIRAGSDRVASSSGNLAQTASRLTAGADQTTRMSVEVAAAAEQMSGSLTEVAATVEQVSGSNNQISSAAESMLASVNKVAESVSRAVAVATEATDLVEAGSGKIGRLGDAAGEIGEVSQVIQDIADMTNLLALNATIEAARAGEAGKGFAVVAHEVKELSHQTSKATEQIRQKIDAIQTASDEAVELIGRIDDVIRQVRSESDEIAETVTGQGETTQQIASQITEAATAAEVVSTNVAQTAEASREIARSIVKVDAAAKDTATAASATQSSGDELSELSGQLTEALSSFQLPSGSEPTVGA